MFGHGGAHMVRLYGLRLFCQVLSVIKGCNWVKLVILGCGAELVLLQKYVLYLLDCLFYACWHVGCFVFG